MQDIVIFIIISFLISLAFILLGFKQYKSEKPVVFNMAEKAPLPEELTSVTEWNKGHGKGLIFFGYALFGTLMIFEYGIKKYDGVLLQVLVLVILVVLETVALILNHVMLKEKLLLKND